MLCRLHSGSQGLWTECHLRKTRNHKPVTCCRSQARGAAYPAAGTRWSAQEWPSHDKPVRRAPLRNTHKALKFRALHPPEQFRTHVTLRKDFNTAVSWLSGDKSSHQRAALTEPRERHRPKFLPHHRWRGGRMVMIWSASGVFFKLFWFFMHKIHTARIKEKPSSCPRQGRELWHLVAGGDDNSLLNYMKIPKLLFSPTGWQVESYLTGFMFQESWFITWQDRSDAVFSSADCMHVWWCMISWPVTLREVP